MLNTRARIRVYILKTVSLEHQIALLIFQCFHSHTMFPLLEIVVGIFAQKTKFNMGMTFYLSAVSVQVIKIKKKKHSEHRCVIQKEQSLFILTNQVRH